MNSRNLCAYLLILLGVQIWIGCAIFYYGYNYFFKTAVQIGMLFVPLDRPQMVWVEIPVGLEVKAVLKSARCLPFNQLKNNTLGIGYIDFEVEMEQLTPKLTEVFPILWSEEGGELDQIMRYMFVAAMEEINYAKYITSALGGLALVVAVIALIVRWRQNKYTPVFKTPELT